MKLSIKTWRRIGLLLVWGGIIAALAWKLSAFYLVVGGFTGATALLLVDWLAAELPVASTAGFVAGAVLGLYFLDEWMAPLIRELDIESWYVVFFLIALPYGLGIVGLRLATGFFDTSGTGTNPLVLDTSVLVDGRVADVVEHGFLNGAMVVPDYVAEELQSLADSSARLKRERGRRGLEVMNGLREDPELDFTVEATRADAEADVDSRLLRTATRLDGRLVTGDFNLNRRARAQGVEVLNLNDLSNALKPVHLPGEEFQLELVKPGDEPGQGVGYLEDGTMIVVEDGVEHIGEEVTVTVTSHLQTSAGRMVFAELSQ